MEKFSSFVRGDDNRVSRYWEDPGNLMCTDPAADPLVTSLVNQDIAKQTKNLPNNTLIQTCPLLLEHKPAEEKKQPTNTKCTFNTLKISKPNRGFDLVIKSDTPEDKRTLAITSGFTKKPATVFFEIDGPVCSEIHNSKRSFDTGSSTLKILPESTDNKLAVEVSSASNITIFPWNVVTNKHNISAGRCGHSTESAILEVFPDTEWEFQITWNFGKRERNDKEGNDISQKKAGKTHAEKGIAIEKNTANETIKRNNETGIEIKGKLKYDGKEREIEGSVKSAIETLRKIEGVVTKAHKALSRIRKNKEEAESAALFDSPISLGIKRPNVGFKFEGKWKEDTGKPTVSYLGSLAFVGEPFLGFYFKWNITDTILQSVPAGIVAKRILKRLKTEVLVLELSAGGEVAGEIKAEIGKVQSRADADWEFEKMTGKIKPKVPISLELTAISFELDNYFIHGTIKAKVGTESGFVGLIEFDSNGIVFKAGFLDFVVWCSGTLEGGIGKSDHDENTEADVDGTLTEHKSPKEFKYILYKVENENETKEFARYPSKKD
jgi:hypothetical protein